MTGWSSNTVAQEKPIESDLKLWFEQPADAMAVDDPYSFHDDKEWLKALPLGNGSLGVMVFGDIDRERIQLNEESMWSGSPMDQNNPEAYAAQKEIRQLLFNGNYKEATTLTNKTQITKGPGSGLGEGAEVPFGSFQTLGDLWIDFEQKGEYTDYYRELNLNDATVNIQYTQNNVKYRREIFTSHPDQVMVARFTADQPGKISFTCSLSRPEHFKVYNEEDQLVMSGSLPDGKGGKGLKFITRLKAKSTGGQVNYEDSKLIVKGADEVTLYLTASTNYLLESPTYLGKDYRNESWTNMELAYNRNFMEMLQVHKEDYQSFFNRVSLDITPKEVNSISTDKRLEKYKKTREDLFLEELKFHYGRYLLISSSRLGTLPANLQGIWSNKIQSPWNGDYHTDVNVQMNYWPAEVTNLSEMHLPLFDLLNSLVEPGKKTASIHYRNNGWVLHPITNVWGYTSPGESASWGMHATGGAWLSTHIWEHYSFTMDRSFLKEMYPILREAVLFYLDWLVRDPETGKLVSGPAVSPENSFIAPDGSISQISMGPSHDQQVISQLFSDFLNAIEVLKVKDEITNNVRNAVNDLAKPSIGSDGRLMEWREEFEEVEPGHRHISHLFGLHPGSEINYIQTPELMKAAGKSLKYSLENGGGHTGWSAAWLINQYARLKEGEKAKQSLETVLTKSTSPNLLGQHPPFQIDANFGTTAGMAEMLLQSHTGIIEFLPALPEAWKTGKVKGLRSRGGFIVDMEWEEGQLKFAKVKATTKNGITVKYGSKQKKISLEKDEVFTFTP